MTAVMVREPPAEPVAQYRDELEPLLADDGVDINDSGRFPGLM